MSPFFYRFSYCRASQSCADNYFGQEDDDDDGSGKESSQFSWLSFFYNTLGIYNPHPKENLHIEYTVQTYYIHNF